MSRWRSRVAPRASPTKPQIAVVRWGVHVAIAVASTSANVDVESWRARALTRTRSVRRRRARRRRDVACGTSSSTPRAWASRRRAGASPRARVACAPREPRVVVLAAMRVGPRAQQQQIAPAVIDRPLRMRSWSSPSSISRRAVLGDPEVHLRDPVRQLEHLAGRARRRAPRGARALPWCDRAR